MPVPLGGISFSVIFSIKMLLPTSPGKTTLPPFCEPFINKLNVVICKPPLALLMWHLPQWLFRIGATSFTKLTPPAILAAAVLAAAFDGVVLAAMVSTAGFSTAALAFDLVAGL